MGQTDSSPATVDDINDLQDKLHNFHDIVSEVVGSGTAQKDLKTSLSCLDEGIERIKQALSEDRELSEIESRFFNCIAKSRDVVVEVIGIIMKMKSREQLSSMVGVLRLSNILNCGVAGPPNDLLSAFFKIELAFMQTFTENQSASFGYIIHEECVKKRNVDDDNKLAVLRDRVKNFIGTELPHFGEPENIPFPHQVDILAELAFVAEIIKTRFLKADSDKNADRKDASRAVSTYCVMNTLHFHLLSAFLIKFRTVNRETDAIQIVEKMQLLKERMKLDLGFWLRFWQDFQADPTRDKFFEVIPESNAKSQIAIESKERRNSVMCITDKGVMVVHDTPDKACHVYVSTYDFHPIETRTFDMNMLACLYKLSKYKEGDDPTDLRVFCEALLDIKALTCRDLPCEDMEVFRTILKQGKKLSTTRNRSCFVM